MINLTIFDFQRGFHETERSLSLGKNGSRSGHELKLERLSIPRFYDLSVSCKIKNLGICHIRRFDIIERLDYV